MRTLSQYNRLIDGLQIWCKQLWDIELSDKDCIQLIGTPEGRQLIEFLESLPALHQTSQTTTIYLSQAISSR